MVEEKKVPDSEEIRKKESLQRAMSYAATFVANNSIEKLNKLFDGGLSVDMALNRIG